VVGLHDWKAIGAVDVDETLAPGVVDALVAESRWVRLISQPRAKMEQTSKEKDATNLTAPRVGSGPS
jgi:hypothetical protein